MGSICNSTWTVPTTSPGNFGLRFYVENINNINFGATDLLQLQNGGGYKTFLAAIGFTKNTQQFT